MGRARFSRRERGRWRRCRGLGGGSCGWRRGVDGWERRRRGNLDVVIIEHYSIGEAVTCERAPAHFLYDPMIRQERDGDAEVIDFGSK